MSNPRTRNAGIATAVIAAAAVTVLVLHHDDRPENWHVIPDFPSENAALAVSRRAMRDLQTEATRNDPETVTRYLWGVRDDGAGNWALMLPPGSQTNRVPPGLTNRILRGDQPAAEKWMNPTNAIE